ncbi:MAG: DUF4870 domain-containing protein [bacterium]|nr:DUF4870 domain-containing protein [bacterium]
MKKKREKMEERDKFLSFIAYLFGWVSGLIIFSTEKKSEYVKFNAMQSIFFSGATMVLFIIITVISSLPFIGKFLSIILYPIAYLFSVVVWIILLVKSIKGEYIKLPLLGDFAEKYSKITL